MIVRALTGIVFIGVIIGSLLWSPHAVTALFMGFMILGVCEFYGLFKKHDKVDVYSGLVMSLALIISALGILSFYDVISTSLFIISLLPILFIGLVSEIWRKKKEPLLNSAVMMLGMVYVVLPFFGPSSVRDTFGTAADLESDYLFGYVKDIGLRNSITGLRVVNARNTYYEAGDLLDGAAIDKYSFMRDAYIQRREYQINEGREDEEVLMPPYQNPYE